MEEKDIAYVHQIEEESFSIPWTIQAFREEIDNERAHYVVLEEDGRIIGYGGFWQILDEGHFTNLAVTSEYRGKGFGVKLVRAMIESCKELNITSVTLEVRESNKAALRAYVSVGFHIEGKRKRYYANPVEDAIIMWMSL